jgi:hypothetical protein
VLPPGDTPLLARRAALLQCTALADARPIAMHHLARFRRGHAIDELLAGRTHVGIALVLVDEVTAVEPALCPRIRRQRLRHIGLDADFLAGSQLFALEEPCSASPTSRRLAAATLSLSPTPVTDNVSGLPTLPLRAVVRPAGRTAVPRPSRPRPHRLERRSKSYLRQETAGFLQLTDTDGAPVDVSKLKSVIR